VCFLRCLRPVFSHGRLPKQERWPNRKLIPGVYCYYELIRTNCGGVLTIDLYWEGNVDLIPEQLLYTQCPAPPPHPPLLGHHQQSKKDDLICALSRYYGLIGKYYSGVLWRWME
jgi:hypothetical protein